MSLLLLPVSWMWWTGCGQPPAVIPVRVDGPSVDAASFAELSARVPDSSCAVRPRLLVAGLLDAAPERFTPVAPWLMAWAGDRAPDDEVHAARRSVCDQAPRDPALLHDRSAALTRMDAACALTRQGLHTRETLARASSPDDALLGAHVYRELRAGGIADTDARTVATWISDRDTPAPRPTLAAVPDDAVLPVAAAFSPLKRCGCHPQIRGTADGLWLDGAPVTVEALPGRVVGCDDPSPRRRLDPLWVGDRDVPMGTVLEVAAALMAKGGMRAVVAGDDAGTVTTPVTAFFLLAAQEPGDVVVQLASDRWRVLAAGAPIADGPPGDLAGLLGPVLASHDPDRARYVLQFPPDMPWGEAAPLVAGLHELHPGLAQTTFAPLR